jgi:Tol biopolymer transport system component
MCFLITCTACKSQNAASSTKDEILSLAFIGSDGNVWLTRLEDSIVAALTSNATQQRPYAFSERGSPWGPDGDSLIVENSDFIYQFDIPSSSVTLIGEGHNAIWSPDGTRIVFVKGLRHFWTRPLEIDPVLVVQRADEQQPEFSTTGYAPCWTEDGSHLIYTTILERELFTATYEIQSWAVGTVEPEVEFTLQTYPIVEMRLAAQDSYLAIRSAIMEYASNLTIMNLDGKEVWRSRGEVEGRDNFAWSPTDPLLVAYNYGTGIEVFDARDATKSPMHIGTWWVAWAPNGKYFATIAGKAGGFQVIVINTDGELLGSSDLFHGDVIDESEPVAWSPDGRYLAFSFRDKVYVAAMGEQLQFHEIADGHTPRWKP